MSECCSKDNQKGEFKSTQKISEGNGIIPLKYLRKITINLENQKHLYSGLKVKKCLYK